MEERLSLRQKYQVILTKFAPAGAVGMSLLIGSSLPSVASAHPGEGSAPGAAAERVSERLAAIREAVSTVAGQQAPDAEAETRMAWGIWWHPYGWGNFGWPNWNNWHNWNNWGNWGHNW